MDSPTSQPASLFPISSSATAAATSATTATATAAASDIPHTLFPLPSSAVTSTPPQWLRNSSFTTDLSLITPGPSSHLSNPNLNLDDVDDKSEPTPKPPSYIFLESSGSEGEAKKKKRNKKEKKRKREKRGRNDDDVERFSYNSRKSGVRAWDDSQVKPSKDYYLDVRGDPDNLAFGSLYKMDVVRYKLQDHVKSLGSDLRMYSRLSYQNLPMRGELDVDGLDSRMKSIERYWSVKYSALERHRNIKRIRIVAPDNSVQTIFDEFIPLSEEDGNEASIARGNVIEESWEDAVLQKTREFNKMTREQPHNVGTWLAFAEFQDKVASRQPQKGARLQTLEKKISILEKAVELNPEDEELLIYLLKVYQNKDSADVLIGRWEKVLMQHSGSYKLWREFLRVVQSDFSRFKVSEVRKMYAHAIRALCAASIKKHRQVCPAMELPSPDNVDVDVEDEVGIIDIFISLCRFEWQAGYCELATALFQAIIEYSLFCPPLQLTEQSKKRLFEHFWNSNAARVGEDGALGWSTWLEKEEENRQQLIRETSSKEDEHGAWTGWFVPPSNDKENLLNLDEAVGTDVPVDDMEEENKDEDSNVEEDDAALLRMLGIDADAQANSEVHDTRTWVRWSEEESSRDLHQWMPVHVKSGIPSSSEAMEEGEEQLSRVILFEDVSDYLFSLRSAEARLSLVLLFIDFFGGEIPNCICTNSSSWKEKILSLDAVPNSILKYIESLYGVENFESRTIIFSSESLLHRRDSFTRTQTMKFLRNAALLCLRVFPRNYMLEEAILVAEEHTSTGTNTFQQASMPSRALAKHLLKSDRQDVLLCGVYARREAAFGNIDLARKVFDMALSSIGGLSLENQSAAMLCFWYSEMELTDGSGDESESRQRALHILSCLGSGTAYIPYKGQPSRTQLLRANQGFKERIYSRRSSWTRHIIDDSSVALICSAALFEELTAGCAAGVGVLSDALSMVLPEKKMQSYQLEFLLNYQVRMLQKHQEEVTLSKVLQFISAGLRSYPSNPELLHSLVNLTYLHTVPNKLRRIFDDLSQKNPSVILCLFALSYELSRGGSDHRIHGIFERSLANDGLHSSVILWRCYLTYEIARENFSAARRVFFRAIHACPWSKALWLDGFQKLNNILSAKELMELQEVMRDKELNLRTDIYEILLLDEFDER